MLTWLLSCLDELLAVDGQVLRRYHPQKGCSRFVEKDFELRELGITCVEKRGHFRDNFITLNSAFTSKCHISKDFIFSLRTRSN